MICNRGIYKILNVVTGDFYIGSSVNVNARIQTHRNKLIYDAHGNRHLQNAFNKYGLKSFKFELIREVVDAYDLTKIEQVYIDTLKPVYNKRLIAESNLGIRRTEEEKENLRIFWTGKKRKKRTLKHKRNLARSLKGKNKGISKPPGFAERLSNARKGDGNPAFGKPSHRRRKIVRLDLISNKIVEKFDSIRDAADKLNVNHSAILACIAGRSKSCCGSKWRYN